MTNKEMVALFDKHKNLVYSVISKKYWACNDKEDLYQEGFIGLWKAVKSFDNAQNTKFSTFAYACINNQINMFFRHERKAPISVTFSQLENYEIESLYFENENFYCEDYVSTLNSLTSQELKLFNKIAHGATQKEIAKEYGVSCSLISRNFNRIKNKLRNSMEGQYEKRLINT